MLDLEHRKSKRQHMKNLKKPLIIIGAGGLGRETCWLVKRINMVSPIWDVVGFIDDNKPERSIIYGKPVLGNVKSLLEYTHPTSVICAIASVQTRRKIVTLLEKSPYLEFPNIIDPDTILSEQVRLGKGNICFPHCIFTVDITVNDFNIINNQCTIGHDSKLDSFVTLYPSVNISGNVTINSVVEIGTGSQVIQGITINSGSVLGAGSVVISDIPSNVVAVGCPAAPIKFRNETV